MAYNQRGGYQSRQNQGQNSQQYNDYVFVEDVIIACTLCERHTKEGPIPVAKIGFKTSQTWEVWLIEQEGKHWTEKLISAGWGGRDLKTLRQDLLHNVVSVNTNKVTGKTVSVSMFRLAPGMIESLSCKPDAHTAARVADIAGGNFGSRHQSQNQSQNQNQNQNRQNQNRQNQNRNRQNQNLQETDYFDQNGTPSPSPSDLDDNVPF